MKHTTLRLALFVFTSTLSAYSANACGFDEITAGICPAEQVEQELAARGTGERAVIYAGLTWGKFKEFSKASNSADIILNVCVFREGGVTVFESQPQMVSFAKNPQKFENVGKSIEKAASSWSGITGKAIDSSKIVSRLSFNFRTGTSKIRACEETTNNHILISMNNSRTNFSAVGWRSLKAANTGKSHRATMTLFYTNGSVDAGTVRHEFGHALGFLHEMAHSKWAGCAKAFLVKDYVNSSGFTFGDDYTSDEKEALAKKNIQDLVQTYLHTADPSDNFDSTSIMTYKLEEKFFDPATKPPGVVCAFKKNISALSDTDKKWFLRYYGKKTQ